MKVANLLIDGMTCHHCVLTVTNALKSLGIQNYNVEIGRAYIVYNKHDLDLETIKAAIEEEGYILKEFNTSDEEYNEEDNEQFFNPESD